MLDRWDTDFQRDASMILHKANPDAVLQIREDLVGKPMQVSYSGASDIIDEDNWKAVAMQLVSWLNHVR